MNKKRKRVAVKIGSNVLTRADGRLNIARMASIVDQVADLHKRGYEVLLISSGAVASGRGALPHIENDESVTSKQLFASVGQAKLIEHYYNFFQEYDITVGQILTTKENFVDEELLQNQIRCIGAMLENEIVPVINENDSVSVKELMFTDNDELSGLVADMMHADLLIILSNVDGLYDGNPELPSSTLIRTVEPDTDYSSCINSSKSKYGRGGMMTKMNTACSVAAKHIEVIIANGTKEGILLDVVLNPESAICTRFLTPKQKC